MNEIKVLNESDVKIGLKVRFINYTKDKTNKMYIEKGNYEIVDIIPKNKLKYCGGCNVRVRNIITNETIFTQHHILVNYEEYKPNQLTIFDF